MNKLFQFSLASVLPIMMGCALLVPEETRYLQLAQDHATQAEVQGRLGLPRFTEVTRAGDPVWVYQIYEIAPGGQDTWSTRGSWCDEYVLTFDGQGILRHWTHQSQVHGGELMPSYCIWDRFNPELRNTDLKPAFY